MLLKPSAIHAAHATSSGDGDGMSVLALIALMVLAALSGMLWAKAYDEED